jgi:hypothetical protein
LQVTPASAWKYTNRTYRCRIESVWVSTARQDNTIRIILAVSGYAEKEARPILRRQRHEQLTASRQTIEPEGSGVGRAGKDHDGIHIARGSL